MTGTAILTAIIEILTGGLTSIGSAIGSALSTLANSVFIDSSGTTPTLSTFGSLVVVFAGISLGLALCRWVINFITSLGQRNR